MLFATFIFDGKVFAISHEDDLQGFIDETKELLAFEPEQLIETNSANDDGNKDNKDFSACRLIVKSNKKPQKLNSVGMASGFKDYYIIQFKNEIDAKNALSFYEKEKSVSSVNIESGKVSSQSIDSFELDDKEEHVEGKSIVPLLEDVSTIMDESGKTSLNSWGSDFTGLYAVKNYLRRNNVKLNKVTVAVCDSGIGFQHDFFKDKQDRLERTGFNSVLSDSDESNNLNDHGTAVTSVIVDSTTENVVVRNYRGLVAGEDNSFSAMITAVLQAINDKVDIINCSFSFYGLAWNSAEYKMASDVFVEAYNRGILTVAAGGNYRNIGGLPQRFLPQSSEYVLTVSAITKGPTMHPTYGQGIFIDLTAPGVDLPLAYGDGYVLGKGTSFSSPLTVSACAMLLSLHPEYTPREIFDIIKATTLPYDESLGITGLNYLYGTGILDAVEAMGIKRPIVKADLKPGKYTGEIEVSLSSDNNEKIYYTFSQSFPDKESRKVFTQPIKMYDDQFLLNAISYNDDGIPSRMLSCLYRSSVLESGENFEIDKDGIITAYNGNHHDIIIPSEIKGIKVENINAEAFKDKNVSGITLPNTMTRIGTTIDEFFEKGIDARAFEDNKTLMFIDGESIEEIGMSVFKNCKKLTFCNFPKVKTIWEEAFYGISTFKKLVLPNVTYIAEEALSALYLYYLSLPNLEECGLYTFANMEVTTLYCPKLSKVNNTYIDGKDNVAVQDDAYVFSDTSILGVADFPVLEDVKGKCFSSRSTGEINGNRVTRLEFSKIKGLKDLPSTGLVSVVLPSTVESLPDDVSAYVPALCKIYGSAGTYVEKYAKEKGFDFIEVTPETAVITDLPKYYKLYMGELEADVVGFNRQYQWYANDVNSNEGGTPIDGATGKNFNPANYYAPYYYCVVTSKDGDFDPITIKTSACENRTQTADYTALDKVLNEFDSSQSELYTAESWSDYSTAVAVGASIDRGLAKSKQNIIDAAIKEIINARNNLVRKNAVSARVIGTPTLGANAVVEITVNGSPKAIRFIDEEKNAVTFDRSSALTVKDGNNEIWRIKLAVTSEKTAYSIFIKYNEDYIDSGVTLTVTASSGPDLGIHSVSIPDMYPSGTYTDGRIYAGVHDVIIRTSKDVLKIQFIDPDGNTRTFSKYSSPPTEDGDELVWTIPLKFNLGKMNLGIRTRAVHTTFALTGEYVTGRVLF